MPYYFLGEKGLAMEDSMAERIQKEKPAPQEKQEPVARDAKDLSAEKEELKDEMDALIEEIDGVLEENAEEFVKAYVQRGGE